MTGGEQMRELLAVISLLISAISVFYSLKISRKFKQITFQLHERVPGSAQDGKEE